MTLLSSLKSAWSEISRSASDQEFRHWLEQTATVDGNETTAIKALDALDAFLIAAIQEVEALKGSGIDASELEVELTKIWQATYARASTHEEERLKNIWLTRGKAIPTAYPDKAEREKIYKTSLSPRSARKLINGQQAIKNKIEEGRNYALMDREEKLAFIADIIEMVSAVPAFKLAERLGKNTKNFDWREILRWWFARDTLEKQPNPKKISEWYDFVAKNFAYKTTWGIGSLLNLVMGDEDVVGDDPIRALELDDWPRSGLPWIAFWLKELLTWGTLDPVAAFLLARTSNIVDRATAEEYARGYYESRSGDFISFDDGLNGNDLLDPRHIRDWAAVRVINDSQERDISEEEYDIALTRPSRKYALTNITVYPLIRAKSVAWIDAAGYKVAAMERNLSLEYPAQLYHFRLDVAEQKVFCSPYLKFKHTA